MLPFGFVDAVCFVLFTETPADNYMSLAPHVLMFFGTFRRFFVALVHFAVD